MMLDWNTSVKLLVSDPSAFDVKITVSKVKRHKLPDIDEILA
jgi:hypothetical protein